MQKRLANSTPTLADVARAAGVSAMTVSNVVNGREDRVTARTRERVETAIREIGYRPHANARALRASREWTIGLLCISDRADFLALQWVARMIAGLSNSLNTAGYGLLLHNVHPKHLDDSLFLRWARTDGIVTLLMGPQTTRKLILGRLAALRQPMVALQEPNTSPSRRDIAILRQDDFGAGVAIGECLLAEGVRRILFVQPGFTSPGINERIRGVRLSLSRYPSASMEVVRCEGDHFEAVNSIVRGTIRTGKMPDAIVGANDSTGLAILASIEAMGFRVPGDVRVAGFNAFENWFYASRKMTTIDFPAYKLGERAGTLISERLANGRFSTKLEVLPARLIKGDTS